MPVEHPATGDWAYLIDDGNSTAFAVVKAAAIAAGGSGTAEQQLVAATPDATELDDTWWPEDLS